MSNFAPFMSQYLDVLLAQWATPFYIAFIVFEIMLSAKHNLPFYSVKDTLVNIWLMSLNGGIDLLFRVVYLGVFLYFYQLNWVEPIPTPWVYWTVLLLAEDFMFYWLHRIDHYCRLFWAIHVTHHSSEHFNLTVGFRSSVFQPLYRFVYFIPIAALGFKPEDIMLMYSVTQIWGILIHTRHIGKLGFLEYFLCTPSHHRVHHGSNARYLDKNMGMFLIVWDKMFGTFQAEVEEDKVRFGLTTPLNTHHPVKVVVHEWQNIGKDLAKAPTWKSRFMYLFGPPGWSHDGSSKTSHQLRKEQGLE